MTPCENVVVLIPALKKTVAFQDDLVKKLDGITLVQRAINKAIELGVDGNNIHLITDSEEIRLIAERNQVQYFWDPSLSWDAKKISKNLFRYLCKASSSNDTILLLSPYAPILDILSIKNAISRLSESGQDVLKPVKSERLYTLNNCIQNIYQIAFGDSGEIHRVVSSAFTLMKSNVIKKWRKEDLKVLPWELEDELFVITSFQDWWVCEKLLQRKRIVFRVIGNEQVGMGHIYRAISLAHEVTDHEILFVSDTSNRVAVNELAGYDYWLGIYDKKQVVNEIIALDPDLVINDILNTDASDTLPLKEHGIKVVNFEDLGDGVKHADIVINELYDEPQIDGDNILWGIDYFFIRDEFHDAKPNNFNENIDSVLLAFGGTDQHDLSSKIYHSIKDICLSRNIHINIVTGPAYAGYERLRKKIENDKSVSLTHATGVISRVMEKSQIAITSNGRTVYELAYMNIPAIVIPLHGREETHSFACDNNGFIVLDKYSQDETESDVAANLTKLLDDANYRKKLFNRNKKFCFKSNKQYVVDLIQGLLN